jgi:hypothetical protein
MDALTTMAAKIAALERRLTALETREYTQAVTGSWTPTDQSGASLSLTVTDADYVKIGRMVFASFAITYPTTASGLGARIGGLPFTSEASGASIWPAVISYTTLNLDAWGLVDVSDTKFRFWSPAGAQITNTQFSTKVVRGAAIYRAA